MSAVSILPPAVRTFVHDFDARARRLTLLRAVGIALTVLAAWVLVCCTLDRVLQLGAAARGVLLFTGVMTGVGILWRPVRASLRRQVDWVDAAGKVERHDPRFGQRLVTVTSRVLGAAEHRGSDEMLRELLREVDRQAAGRDASALLPLRRIALPWAAFGLAVLAFAVLARVPGFGLPRLAGRLITPWADVRPVTTTSLAVRPGSRDVVQSEPLKIEADVERLDPTGLVSLFVSGDGGEHWSRSTMEPAASPVVASPSSGSSTAGRFTFTLTSVDRDLRYYVTAGDATSPTYDVRVRRPPAIDRFSIRYEYPRYTGRSALTVVNTDGLIEAPVGTRAVLTVSATEPLNNALLTVAGEKIVMDRTDDVSSASAERTRRATMIVRRDGRYSIDLISDRQVAGAGPAGTMLIRAIPDGKPLVRLPQGGESLRLHPREILPLNYQALDDYGLASLVLAAQVNSAKPVEVPLEMPGDPRRQEQAYDFDLATMPLAIGDVLTLSLVATDLAGQRSASEAVQVLVSPRTVDVSTYQRISELNAAAGLAATLHEQLTAAAAALDEADREAATRSLAFLAAINRANRQLTGAAETATLMRQAMYRALVNGRSPALATALAGWIDEAQVQSWLAEDLFRRADAPAGMGSESRGLLARSLVTTRLLRDEVRTIAAGERAAAVLADRENLLASQRKAAAAGTTRPADAQQRLAQSLRRAEEDIAAGAREVGVDPAAADLDAQLKAMVDAAQALLGARVPVDFAAAAREWAAALQRERTQPVVFDERLSAASQAEAVRADADLIRAHDLQLAARAAARIEAVAQSDPSARAVPVPTFDAYADALGTLQREHVLYRRPTGQPVSAQELEITRQASRAAREFLERWAGDPAEPAAGGPLFGMPARHAVLEDLALRAGAETALRNYAEVAQLDAQLARNLADPSAATRPSSPDPSRVTTQQADAAASGAARATNPSTTPVTAVAGRAGEASGWPEPVSPHHRQIQQTVRRAETLDRLGGDQERLAAETGGIGVTTGPTTEPVPALAGQQREVANAIAQVSRPPTAVRPPGAGASGEAAAADPSWRGRATAAVLAAQEALAAMPQQLAAAQDALPAWREALARAEQARDEAGMMPDATLQPAAERAAAQAEREAADAAQRFRERRRPISPSAAQQLASSLEPFAPETDGATDVVAHGLLPALQRLEDAGIGGNIAGFARAADEARQSIESAQRELARAQDALTARDPLVAAKWFARAAADSLERSDMRQAQARQRETRSALERAWDRTIHEAAALRMSSLPAFQSLYRPPVVPATGPAGVAAAAGSSAAARATDHPAAAADATAAAAAKAATEALLAPGLLAAREWGRLRPREPEAAVAPLRDGGPPGYEEPLRLYFEALGRGQAELPPAAPPPPASAPAFAPSTTPVPQPHTVPAPTPASAPAEAPATSTAPVPIPTPPVPLSQPASAPATTPATQPVIQPVDAPPPTTAAVTPTASAEK